MNWLSNLYWSSKFFGSTFWQRMENLPSAPGCSQPATPGIRPTTVAGWTGFCSPTARRRCEPAAGDTPDAFGASLEDGDQGEGLRARSPIGREPGLAARRHAEAPIVDLDRDDTVRVARAPRVVQAARARQKGDGRLVEGPVEPTLERVLAEEEALQPHSPAGVGPAHGGL